MHRSLIKQPKNTELVNMSTEELIPFPPNCNPFHYDSFRMGADICKDFIMMTGTTSSDKEVMMNEMILVNTKTGQRWKLSLTSQNPVYKAYIRLSAVVGELEHSIRDDVFRSPLTVCRGRAFAETSHIPYNFNELGNQVNSYICFGKHAIHEMTARNLSDAELIKAIEEDYFGDDTPELVKTVREFLNK